MTHVKQTSQQSSQQSHKQSHKPLSNVPKLTASTSASGTSALPGSHMKAHSKKGRFGAEKLVQLLWLPPVVQEFF